MPALSYKSRFVQAVIDGSKPHSIRAWRKRPFKAGDIISHFTGPRMKPRRIRPNTVCTSAASITIDGALRHVILSDYSPRYGFGQLTLDQVRELARRDGFASVTEFFDFFEEHHGKLNGQLIEWESFLPAPATALENGEPARGRKRTPLAPVCSRPAAAGQSEPRGRGRKTVAAIAASHATK